MLTKHLHTSNEAPFGLPLPMDDAEVESDVDDLLEKNTLSICTPHVSSIKHANTAKGKSTLIPTQTKSKSKVKTAKVRLGKIMNKLYDVEPITQPEKPLNIDLDVDLYQMEEL